MNKYLLTGLLAFAILPFFCVAQSNYRPGYVIKASGDTVKGYINYLEWNNSPKSIEFKQTLNDDRSTLYLPTEIKGFDISGRDTYISYNGPVSVSPGQVADLADHADTLTRVDHVFIDVISAGKNLVLYHHEDDIKQRFLISEAGSAPVELKFYLYNSNGKVVTYAPFRQELIRLYKKYVPNGDDKTLELLGASYNKNTIIKYVRIINNNSDVHSDNYSNKANTKIHFFAGVGAAFTNATYSGPVSFGFPQPQSYTTTTPLYNAGINIFPNDEIRSYFFSLGVSYFSYSKTINGNVADFSFKKGIYIISPQVIFNLYNRKMFKFFIGGGPSYNISASQSNQILVTKSGYVVSSSEVDPFAGSAAYPAGTTFDNYKKYDATERIIYMQFQTGIILNQKLQIYVAVTPAKWETNNAGIFSASRRTIFAGLNYLF